MYGFLLERRWIALTLLLVVVVPLSALAAHWQFSRWEERKALNAAITERTAEPAAALGDLVAPGSAPAEDLEWRTATLTGRYDTAAQVLVRKQPLGGRNGYLVVTPLVSAGGTVPVIRGWMPSGNTPPTSADVPAAPSGSVAVTGRVKLVDPHDGPQPSDLPAGQVNWIDPTALAGGSPAYLVALELTASDPAQAPGLAPVPLPELTEGPHLSYVGQWILIGITSLVVWVILVRREAAHRRREAAHSA